MRYLALKPLQFKNLRVEAGDTFTPKNEDAIKPLLDRGIVKTLRDIMDEKLHEFYRWLGSYPVTSAEIKEHSPEVCQAIYDALTEMDNCFRDENLQGLIEAIKRAKALYLRGVEIVKRGRAVFYSPEDAIKPLLDRRTTALLERILRA